jgi:hypothetical protein
MTNPNERIHEAFREYLNTTRLRRDGGSGVIAAAGSWRDRPKMDDVMAALDAVVADYRAGRLTSLDTRYLGERFWRAVVARLDSGEAVGAWNYAREYPNDDLACRQVGEWLVANRHLADDITVPVNTTPATVVLTAGDPVWIQSRNTLGEYRGMSGTLASVVYRRDGERPTTVAVPLDDLRPMRGVPMTLIPDGPRSTYSLDHALRSDPQEVTFFRWYNEAEGLTRDQALYVTQPSGVSSEFIPAWRLQPAVMPVEAQSDGREIRAGAEAGWVFHRVTGRIVWAQGFSQDGQAFDAYPRRNGGGVRLGSSATRSVDYAWLHTGDPLVVQDRSSYGLHLEGRSWEVANLLPVHHEDAIYVRAANGETRARNGYSAVTAVTVDVTAALAGRDKVTEVGEHVLTIDGVEYVRKATVDADMEALTSTLHRAADANGLCAVYDRTVVQVDEATTLLKMGAVRGRYRAVVTETYTITREVEVANEHRSDDHARSAAEVTAALRMADFPGATGLVRSAVTVDRVTRS